MTTEPTILIHFDDERRDYCPGETLAGAYRIESPEAEAIKAVETSVLWHTEGKGDEDMAVHEFWRRDVEESGLSELRRPERFSTVLPNSPLSYDGEIVKVRWCVRVRMFLRRGRDLVEEKGFRLGGVPRPVV
jgi:hypothetical protein